MCQFLLACDPFTRKIYYTREQVYRLTWLAPFNDCFMFARGLFARGCHPLASLLTLTFDVMALVTLTCLTLIIFMTLTFKIVTMNMNLMTSVKFKSPIKMTPRFMSASLPVMPLLLYIFVRLTFMTLTSFVTLTSPSTLIDKTLFVTLTFPRKLVSVTCVPFATLPACGRALCVSVSDVGARCSRISCAAFCSTAFSCTDYFYSLYYLELFSHFNLYVSFVCSLFVRDSIIRSYGAMARVSREPRAKCVQDVRCVGNDRSDGCAIASVVHNSIHLDSYMKCICLLSNFRLNNVKFKPCIVLSVTRLTPVIVIFMVSIIIIIVWTFFVIICDFVAICRCLFISLVLPNCCDRK